MVVSDEYNVPHPRPSGPPLVHLTTDTDLTTLRTRLAKFSRYTRHLLIYGHMSRTDGILLANHFPNLVNLSLWVESAPEANADEWALWTSSYPELRMLSVAESYIFSP